MQCNRRNFLKIFAGSAVAVLVTPISTAVDTAEKAHEATRTIFPEHTDRGKAVIINGGSDDFMFMENNYLALRFLLSIGYGTKDIVMLTTPYEAFSNEEMKYLRKRGEIDSIVLPEIAGPATERNVKAVLETIVGGLTQNKELFVYVGGHGENNGRSSHAQLNKRSGDDRFDELSDKVLNQLIAGHKGGTIVYADTCMSEGFAVNVGSGNITAAARAKFNSGSTTSALFTSYFFTSPWREKADTNMDRQLNLKEALNWCQHHLAHHENAGAALTLVGEYNPTIDRISATADYTVSPFFRYLGLSVIPPSVEEKFAGINGVVYVKTDEDVRKALADRNAAFYFGKEKCEPCELLTPFILEILQEKSPANRPVLYVFHRPDCSYETVEQVAKHHGINFNGYPYLARVEDGKLVKENASVPMAPYSYGNLPDRTINIVDRQRLREVLL